MPSHGVAVVGKLGRGAQGFGGAKTGSGAMALAGLERYRSAFQPQQALTMQDKGDEAILGRSGTRSLSFSLFLVPESPPCQRQ